MYLFTLSLIISLLSLSPLQKLYTVCDVAMNIVISKSTTYSLESPKDPVLPARYFTQPDKVLNCCLSAELLQDLVVEILGNFYFILIFLDYGIFFLLGKWMGRESQYRIVSEFEPISPINTSSLFMYHEPYTFLPWSGKVTEMYEILE